MPCNNNKRFVSNFTSQMEFCLLNHIKAKNTIEQLIIFDQPIFFLFTKVKFFPPIQDKSLQKIRQHAVVVSSAAKTIGLKAER